MHVKTFTTRLMEQNCYLLHNDTEAILVDPTDPGAGIIDFVKDRLRIVAIVNTHGHADHIAANDWYRQRTQAPIHIHEDDAAYLCDPKLNLSGLFGQALGGPAADVLLQHGATFSIDGEIIEVIHTPGHTPGGICLYTPGTLISGDTLFCQSIGRTDLPGGDARILGTSLKELARLPKETKVYPGHGPATSIGAEVATNPFLSEG